MEQEYQIGDFLKRIKRPVDIDANQFYKLVTVKLYHNGVILREHKKGSQIESKMFEVKEGDFILSGIDARNGAFGIVPKELDGAIVTNDFWYFEIDETIIDKRLFLELTATSWFDDLCKKGSDGTTQRIRLQKDKFFNQKIYLPEPHEQAEILKKVLALKSCRAQLDQELATQLSLLAALRQAILTEAVQGQLTAQWRRDNPNQEPAGELLKRIAAEKARLIKEKKISKEKPLPPITVEEMPYEVPEGWVWCRLGEVTHNFGQKIPDKVFTYIDVGTINNISGKINAAPSIILPINAPSRARKIVKKGSVLYSTVRPYLLNIAIVEGEYEHEPIASTAFAVLNPITGLEPEFLFHYLRSKPFVDFVESQMKGVAYPAINDSNLFLGYVPIPPLPEQHAIVQKVNSLLAYCDELEQQVRQSKADLDLLMQAVLGEVFGTAHQALGSKATPTRLSEKATLIPNDITQPIYEGNTLNMELLEILQQQPGGKIAAVNLWKMSKYQKDIDAFYEALKREVEEKKTIKEAAEKGWLELVAS